MKKKQAIAYKQIIDIFDSLHKEYPEHNLGRHLSLALSDYTDLFSVTDREFLYALTKYQTELAFDHHPTASEDYVRKIEEDASHLFDRASDTDEGGDEWGEDDY